MMHTILFVDDDPIVSLLYTKFLGKHGFALHTAANGLEAIHKLRTLSPSLMILDLMMPKLGGQDVLKFLATHPTLASLPVIVFSNSLTDDSLGQQSSNIKKVLLKYRCTPSILLETIEELLQADGTAASSTRTAQDPPPLSPILSEEERAARQAADISALRKLCQELLSADNEPLRLVRLRELRPRIQFLLHAPAIASRPRARFLLESNDALLLDLVAQGLPLSQAAVGSLVAGIETTLRATETPAARAPLRWPPEALILDPDAANSRWTASVLARVNLRPTVENAVEPALKRLANGPADLLVCDSCLWTQAPEGVPARLNALPELLNMPVLVLGAGSGSAVPCGPAHLETLHKPYTATELTVKVGTALLRSELSAH